MNLFRLRGRAKQGLQHNSKLTDGWRAPSFRNLNHTPKLGAPSFAFFLAKGGKLKRHLPETKVISPTAGGRWWLELHDFQAGDQLEVFHIDCDHVEAQMQGRASDHKIFEVDGDALGSLFALDASGKLRDLQRDRMHDHVIEDAISEDTPPRTVGVGFGSVDAVRQFNDADSRECDVDLAMRGPYPAKDVFNAFASPFAVDQDAWMKDESRRLSPMLMDPAPC